LLGAVGGVAVAAGAGGGVLADPGAVEGKHFHPLGKMPSKFTIDLRNGIKATLPFEDKRDFDLWKQWPAHSYHGSSEHNSRGVINRFLGYWDGNPATLIPLSPEDSVLHPVYPKETNDL